MAEASVVPGSDEYNEEMAGRFANQDQLAPTADQPDEVPVPELPEGGYEKFYDAKTGEYNWQNHAKELEYRLNGKKQEQLTEEQVENVRNASRDEVTDVVSRAGLDANQLQQQLNATGQLSEDAYAALAKQGLSRELVDVYVDNYNYRVNSTRDEALRHIGGEAEWNGLSQWAAENLTEGEVTQYNNLLASSEWRVAMDALRVRRDSAYGEPRLMGGDQSINGSGFGYRSKSEMKSDMADVRYTKDPAFRKQVMQRMQSATWDLDQ